MQNFTFIKLNDKLTEKDFIVATDPITYIKECKHTSEDTCCKIHYNLPHAPVDVVNDSIDSIQQSLESSEGEMLCVTDLEDRTLLINPNYILRIAIEEPEIGIYVVTLSDGTTLSIKESLGEIFE